MEKLSRKDLNHLVEYWSASSARPKRLWVEHPATKPGAIEAATCGYTLLLPPGRLDEDQMQAAVVAATMKGKNRFNQIWSSEDKGMNIEKKFWKLQKSWNEFLLSFKFLASVDFADCDGIDIPIKRVDYDLQFTVTKVELHDYQFIHCL